MRPRARGAAARGAWRARDHARPAAGRGRLRPRPRRRAAAPRARLHHHVPPPRGTVRLSDHGPGVLFPEPSRTLRHNRYAFFEHFSSISSS